MIVLVNRYLIRKGFTAMALWPFILVKQKELKEDAKFINHEKIHLRQQIELLILPFYVWYVIEFLVRLLIYKNRRKAYLNISFEQEAYKNEKDLGYLKKRSFWRFLRYFNP